MMLMLINIKLNVKHHYDFEEIRARLSLQILIAGFNGVLDIGWVEDFQMIKDKLLDEKELQVDLKVNQLK